jgi:hypothetical protein
VPKEQSVKSDTKNKNKVMASYDNIQVVINDKGFTEIYGMTGERLYYTRKSLDASRTRFLKYASNYRYYRKLSNTSYLTEDDCNYNKDIDYTNFAKDSKGNFVRIAVGGVLVPINDRIEFEMKKEFSQKNKLASEIEKIDMLDAWGYKPSQELVRDTKTIAQEEKDREVSTSDIEVDSCNIQNKENGLDKEVDKVIMGIN